ncbi:hypothetical protein [Micromonospora deserti]|uniref:Lipoprotein n=1 Tax=Micromonospora deserti TaxID=2070366 RepID=A0A2W2CBS2_9ACTN|nr:hypothetical protein [Micromonospora deserti]PZF96721.1 hypothetical protein C1I99_16880 [Micromonospora deserti]
MPRVARIVAVLLVSGTLFGCGTDAPPDRMAPTGAASVTPVASPAAYVTFEQAVSGHLKAGGASFVGRCEGATSDPRTLCAVKTATVDGGEVYGIGVPYSEIDGYLLMREGPGGWEVLDEHTPAGGPEPAPSWFAAVG